MLWKALVTRYGGRVTESLDVSSLAKITDGYTPGHMAQAIQQILTERRIQQVGEQKIILFMHLSDQCTAHLSFPTPNILPKARSKCLC